MKYFQCLVRELATVKPKFAHLYNLPDKEVRQSSVSIIFRVGRP